MGFINFFQLTWSHSVSNVVDVNVNCGHSWHVSANDEPLAGDKFDGADGLVDLIGDLSRAGDQRSSGIDDSLATTLAHDDWLVGNEAVSVDGDGAHVDLPVGLSADVVPNERVWESAFESLWVNASPGDLAADVGLAGLRAVSVDKEGEHAVDLAFFHELVVDGSGAVDGNGWVSKTHDAVKSSGEEGDAGLFNSFGKSCLLGDKPSGAWCDIYVIGGLEADHGAGSVLDLEFRSILGPRARQIAVVLVVVQAGKAGSDVGIALARWNPQVGRTGVEDDGEVLGRRSDCEWAKVLSVEVVGKLVGGHVSAVL